MSCSIQTSFCMWSNSRKVANCRSALVPAGQVVRRVVRLVAAEVTKLKFPRRNQQSQNSQSLVTSAATIFRTDLEAGTPHVCVSIFDELNQVAQTCSLLYRRLVVCNAPNFPEPSDRIAPVRLQT